MSIYTDRLIHTISKPAIMLRTYDFDTATAGAAVFVDDIQLAFNSDRYWNIDWVFDGKQVLHENFPFGNKVIKKWGEEVRWNIQCPKLTKTDFRRLLMMYNLRQDIGVDKKLQFWVHGGNPLPPATLYTHLADNISFDVTFENNSFRMEYPNNRHWWHSASFQLVTRVWIDEIPTIYYAEDED